MRPWTRWGATLWHRIDKRVPGAHYLNTTGADSPAKLLIAGHQNGLADPVLACVMMDAQLHFFTRADVFRKPVWRWLLLRFNMMPVFRAIDRAPNMAERNKATFEAAHDRLEQGAVCGIFPEAGHLGERRIRRVRNGTARLIVGALHRPEIRKRGLDVLPIQLDFERYEGYRTTARVRIGAPIHYADIPHLLSDSGTSRRALSARIHTGLVNHSVHLLEPPLYEVHLAACRFLEGVNEGPADASLLQAAADAIQRNPIDALRDFNAVLYSGIGHPRISDDFAALGRLKMDNRTKLMPHLWRLPAWLVFILTTGWWPRLAEKWAGNRLKDVAFRTTFSVPITMVGVTITWFLLAVGIGLWSTQPFALPAALILFRTAQHLAMPLEDALIDLRTEHRVSRSVPHAFIDRWCLASASKVEP